jgi:3-methylfumaryl-CoA hydratase
MFEAGTPSRLSDSCTLSAVQRIASMLGAPEADLFDGARLPRGWHFFLLGANTPRSDIRADGFPGLGVPMPDLGLPRLMLGGRTVEYRSDLLIGDAIERTSAVESIVEKQGPSGPFAIARIAHALKRAGADSPAIVETQTYLLMAAGRRYAAGDTEGAPPPSGVRKQVTCDQTMLFQYSALGFNSHKIHLDRQFAQDAEGFPDLVVNGGLATLLLTEFARAELGLTISALKTKHLAPLFCDRPISLAAVKGEAGAWGLTAYDDEGRVAVTAEVTTQ